MKKSSAAYLSQLRKKISVKMDRLKQLYLWSCSSEVLFHGQPGSVFRKCGKVNCRCTAGGDQRHGPYQIIRIFREGKSTQITLKNDERHFFDMAKRHQQQVRNRREIISIQSELLSLFEDLMEGRTIWSKEEYEKE
jgi:hypothetical protein